MFLSEKKEKMKDWFLSNARGSRAKWWISIISFAESSFFPIPTDPFLMAILLVERHRWLYFSILTTLTSVIGGVFGYLIGYAFFETLGKPIVSFYHLEEEVVLVAELFNQNAFLAMFTAAFTPIPYKIFTISAGLFKVSLLPFILASLLGRSIRYLVVGYVMYVFGEKIGQIVFKYFNIFTLVFGIAIILYIAHSLAF